ncbi:hypothetical protein Cob_v002808 [Colletotrichum orbiculare MAFF 240422]|uniref:Uncharacterized protein n=1 Tax=Colletotrichum orbiculare (strain 104-T / ATCC 96160 / CBS 514.97 / LARS 414 / MAFF 240422) TaxID=1213857 RepID=A0A484G176_COLOR|nr:hypothetical protein Cob_v002808 [Colletotrichum orbiculare MAFF 240422]
MSDENGPRSPTSPVTATSNISRKQTVSSPGATPSPAPSGHSMKRAVTVDEAGQMRRRPPFSQLPTDSTFVDRGGLGRRRSSTLSDYSFGDARDLLNPRPTEWQCRSDRRNAPWLVGRVPTLVRDTSLELVPIGTGSSPSSTASTLNGHAVRGSIDDTSEEVPTTPTSSVHEQAPKAATRTRKDDAVAELWVHEILALVSCFMFPVLGAYLLHAIRAQLSRPSEGLVSNYNLTIFLLAAELRPLSHLMKLVQCRTLSLQREVHVNPFKEEAVTPDQVRVLMARLELLESRPEPMTNKHNGNSDNAKIRQEASIARDVRNAIQPDLDALNRAVRRYEKKATVLAFQTESRFAAVDTRLNDAIALAAAAAKNSVARPGFFQWLVESVWAIVTMPFYAVVALLVLPFKTVRGLLKRKKKQLPERRSSRNGKAMGHGRMATDRPPSRVSKR